jgi:predicted dehydrogenase
MTDGTPRVALIGYGMAGRDFHAPLLVAAGAPPSLVATSSAERAAQVRAALPGAEVVTDLDAALAAAPDLVVLASPTGAHVDQALACIRVGVPFVVDKPIAVDARGAREVVEAAAAARVACTVFQNRRWDPETRTLTGVLARGDLGTVHRFERRWERWRPVPKERWRERLSAAEGGGVLLDLGPHLVDAARLLFGPVASVHAELAARTTTAEDDVFLSLAHVNGVRSHLTAGSLAGAPGPRTRVLGDRAAFVVGSFEDDGSPFGAGIEDAPGHCGWIVAGEDRRPVPERPGEYADFYRAVLSAVAGPDPDARQAAMPVDPRDAVATAEILDVARVSAAESRTVWL